MSELLSWFSGRPENRRRYPRRAGGFRAWMALGTNWVSVAGVDISASGVGLLSPQKIDKDESNMRVVVEGKPIMVRAKQVWCIPGTLQGKPVWRYGMQFTGIAADDWDALVRFCSGEAVNVENQAQKELTLVRMKDDDVARLVPARLQSRLLQMLVERRRLAPLEPNKNPLVQYAYGGVRKHRGENLHHLQITSRIYDESSGESRSFDTRFVFDDRGERVEMDER